MEADAMQEEHEVELTVSQPYPASAHGSSRPKEESDFREDVSERLSSLSSWNLVEHEAPPPHNVKSIFGRGIKGNSLQLNHQSESVYNRDEPLAHRGFVDGNFANGKVFDLQVSGCFTMAFHPQDACVLAVGLLGGHGVALYETQNYTRVSLIEMKDSVSSLSWLRVDGCSLLAVGCMDGSVSVYRLKPDLLELQGADRIDDFQVGGQVRAISLSLYGKLETEVLLCVGDKDGGVTFSRYDLSGNVVQQSTVSKLDGGILGIAINPEGNLLATCTKSGDVHVHRIQRTQNSVSLGYETYHTKRNGPVRAVVFSYDGKSLLYGGYDKDLVILDTELWAVVRSCTLKGTINTITYDPMNRYVGVGCRDKSFTLFDTSTFLPIKTIQTPGWVAWVAWGKASGSDIVAIRSERSNISILDLSPVHLTPYKLTSDEGSPTSLSWSYDGHLVARIVGSQMILADATRDFIDCSVVNLKGELKCVAFGIAEGFRDLVAVCGLDGYLHIFRLRYHNSEITLKEINSRFVEDNLWVVAWSSDGHMIATGGRLKKLHVLNSANLKQKGSPIEIGGRIWDVEFMPQLVVNQMQRAGSTYGMAVGSGDYIATLFDTSNLQPSLKVQRTRTIRCLSYHPRLPLLAVGDGGNMVSIINLVEEEAIREIPADGRVNSLCFSPIGDIMVVGTDSRVFSFFETNNWKVVQEIESLGFASCAAFSWTGRYVALGSAEGDYRIVQLGPFLAINLVPLAPVGGINHFPKDKTNEVIYRSGNQPSFVQRYMLEGSPDSLRRAADLLKAHPATIYCFDRSTGESCFDIAMKLNKPNLLKLVLSTLVDGTLDGEEDGRRSILTSNLPEVAANKLREMMKSAPPEYIDHVLCEMTFVKVPFTQAHETQGARVQECASSSYTDPWNRGPERKLERTENKGANLAPLEERGLVFRVPAVLPLPDLGKMGFLTALLDNADATAFDNPAMGLVLRVMWRGYIRIYFLFDLAFFASYFGLWVLLVDWTASTTSATEGSLGDAERGVSIAVMVLNSMFALKEAFQSRCGKRISYFKSVWNMIDYVSIALVYAYCLSLRGAGSGIVPLAVVTTMLLTLKLLSYLRGFNRTGWLISVLVQNFSDVQGFIVVLLVILFGFTVSFRVLFGSAQGECVLELDDNGEIEEECDPEPFKSIGRAFLSTFELTILGSYDPGVLHDAPDTILSILTFILAIVCVLVVALNALIAVLSDSYARVQENAVANRRKEKAQLIVEYLSILPPWRRRQIEKETRYFHSLLEADEDGDLLVNKGDWEGGLNALKKDLEEMNYDANEMTRQSLDEVRLELQHELSSFRKEVVSILGNLTEEIKEIKHVQSMGGVRFDGRNVAKAVKDVKSIGRQVPFFAAKE